MRKMGSPRAYPWPSMREAIYASALLRACPLPNGRRKWRRVCILQIWIAFYRALRAKICLRWTMLIACWVFRRHKKPSCSFYTNAKHEGYVPY